MNRNVSSRGKTVATKGGATAPGSSCGDCDSPQTNSDDDGEEGGVKDWSAMSRDSGLEHLNEFTAMTIFDDYSRTQERRRVRMATKVQAYLGSQTLIWS